MNAYERLLELKNKREEYVRVSKENNMWEGTKKILTEMYPDTAHFVYELLQNAEDMCATEVNFALKSDKLYFWHNGTKRDFVYEDIDSITSIGNNSLKKDDLTSIGTFGVGFKAVYTYTSTPEIHSGEFDFRIRDMVIPDPIDVPKTANFGETQFLFPFDHGTKKPQDAVAEIKKALLELDENSILFLNHIERINFKLPDDSMGGVQLKNVNKVLKVINKDDAFTKAKTKSFWFKFSNDCEVNTAKGKATLPVSIAFRMNVSGDENQTKFTVDETLKGKVFIYFPAVKERSDFHFHIHAPFASTVARDSVRDCEENNKLLNELAKLAVKSILYFKKSNCIDYHYYASLPNKRDFLNGDTKYKVIYDLLIKVFTNPNHEFIITENGDYKKISEVRQGSREIVKLITSDDLFSLCKKYWVPALRPQTREEVFLKEIGLNVYDTNYIVETLSIYPSIFDPIFQKNLENTEWFIRLYELLNTVHTLHSYIEKLIYIKMLKCNDGRLHSSNENLYIKSSYVPKQIKNPLYVELDTSLSKSTVDAAKEFLTRLGIKVMTEELDLMFDLEKDNVCSDDIVIKLLEIQEKYEKGEEIEQFKESAFILGRNLENGKLYRVKAQECCWDNDVVFFYNEINHVVSHEDYQALNDKEKTLFKEVFVKLGGIVAPKIIECKVDYRHPNWKNLDTSDYRPYQATNSDYTIIGLDNLHRIPEEKLYKESLLLWNVVIDGKNFKCHQASFRANKFRPIEFFESRLAHVLKRVKWIPNKAGDFCRPCDIKAEDLYEGFEYSQGAIFLKNIGFGDESKVPNDITSILERAGVSISAMDEEWFRQSEDVKAEVLRILREQKEKQRMSFTEALKEENKSQSEFIEDDNYGKDVSIKNPVARAKRQQEEFEKGLEKRISMKLVMGYTYNPNTTPFEKQFLREQYKGKCQFCEREAIIKHNGDIYFEAINIINTANLDKSFLNNIDAGWNTLCLCPTCAAEYRYCSKNLDNFEEQVENTVVKARSNEFIPLEITLRSQKIKIKFTPRHFIALQSAFKIYKKHEDKKDS